MEMGQTTPVLSPVSSTTSRRRRCDKEHFTIRCLCLTTGMATKSFFFLVDNSFDIFALYLYIPPPKSITITRLSDYFICVKVLIVNQTESKKSCACGHTFFFTTETLTSWGMPWCGTKCIWRLKSHTLINSWCHVTTLTSSGTHTKYIRHYIMAIPWAFWDLSSRWVLLPMELLNKQRYRTGRGLC